MGVTVDQLWGRLEHLAPVWAELSALIVALLGLAILGRILASEARLRRRAPARFLVAALLFRLSAWGAVSTGLGVAASLLGLVASLCFVVGLVGVAGLVVFDLVLRGRQVPAIVRDLSQIVVVSTIFVGILYQHGFDLMSLAATGGVMTAVVGFALQSTIANVFAGLALPLEGQLSIGDWVDTAGYTGRIREIRWRSTTIVTKDGDHVIVPNNHLITSAVINFSRPTLSHRMAVHVSFHYRHPPNTVRRVLLDAVHGTEGVLTDPAPDCFPLEFGNSAVTYALRVWIDDFLRSDPILGEVRTRVWYAARRAGLEIPYPIHTIMGATEVPDDTTAHRLSALERVDLFAPLDGECRTRLAGGMREQHFAAGEDIIREHDPGDSLFIIAQGHVDVRVGADGAFRTVAGLGPGQFFGEMSLMTGERRQATCTATTDAVCYVIDQAALRCVFETRPRVAEDVSSLLAERQTELEASREGLTAEGRARRTRETRSRLLRAIENVFGL